MKLKSLLLGSAAALVAFSGARAADAVIAEPEPVEYVRVCDAYGAGYFYIPGTETCLKIGGFVRYDINLDDDGDAFGKETVASIQFSAKSDTDLGMLEGFIDLRSKVTNALLFSANPANSGAGKAKSATGLDSAYIALGGLKMGFYSNAFDGGVVGENDDLGGTTTNTIGYTFASGGFDATIQLNEDAGNDLDVAAETNYIPNVTANAGFSAGAFAVRAFFAYDDGDDLNLAGAVDDEDNAFAAKLRVGVDVTEGGRLELAGVYANRPGDSWDLSTWSIAGGYQQKVTDTVTVAVNAQYWSDRNFNLAGSPDRYDIGVNVDWTPVTNFLVRAQVEYQNDQGKTTAAADDAKGFVGRLRFQRSF